MKLSFVLAAAFAVGADAFVLTAQPTSLVGRAGGLRMAGVINDDIDKENPKVVNVIKVPDIKGKKAVYCRCWKSSVFPICDQSHVKHNEACGDNVGPLIIEKEE